MSQPSDTTRPTPSPQPDPRILHAVQHVAQDGLVILPTDTVYGIGCAAGSAHAVGRLLAAKGRGRAKPPPVLVADPQDLNALVENLPQAASALITTFWPGPLTLILDASPTLSWDLGETGGTIAVRMPDHPLTLQLLRAAGPMAVTSANRTGAPPATSAAEARAAFSGRVLDHGPGGARSRHGADILLLDGGTTPGPLPSTIVDLSGPRAQEPVIVREGVIDPRLVHEIARGPGAPHTGPADPAEPAHPAEPAEPLGPSTPGGRGPDAGEGGAA